MPAIFTRASLIVGPWVCERTGGKYNGMDRAIGLVEHQGPMITRILAGVLYDQFNGASISMHVASDGTRRWLNREFLRYAFSYPFEQLGVRRITGLVPSTNMDARRFDEHLGFVHEATLSQAGPGGCDLLVYRMFRGDCRWLEPHKRGLSHGRQIIHA